MIDVGELAIEPEVEIDLNTAKPIQLWNTGICFQGSGSSSLNGSTGNALT